MKRKYLFIFLLTGGLTTLTAQVVAPLPAGDYPDIEFTDAQLDEATRQSLAFYAQPKITAISDTGLAFGTATWPAGSWGRGYQTWPTWTHNVFMTNLLLNRYFAHHPLVRDVSVFFRGHLHLYLSGHDGDHLPVLKAGVDYLLSEQKTTGPDAGGYTWWATRDGKTDTSMTRNGTDIYETAYALAALSEFYLSGIDHKRDEVFDAIRLASENICRTRWRHQNNANIRGLALWSLSASAKVYYSSDVMDEIKYLVRWLNRHQYRGNNSADGQWKTGGQDGDRKCGYWHDTRMIYHFFVIRGLAEAFSVIPEGDVRLKLQVTNTLRRAINHVINYRLVSPSPTDPRLYDLHKNVCGDKVEATTYFSLDVECYVDALAKLAWYAINDPGLSDEERTNLHNLTNKVASGLDPTEKWHLCAIGSYSNYLRAIRDNTSPFTRK